MKSEIEIKDILYNAIKDSALEQAVISAGGRVYTHQRAADSGKEDVVISVSDGVSGQVQSAVANVDIYVQDVALEDNMIENEPRIRELSRLAIELLENFTGRDYHFKIEKQLCLKVKDVNEHYINNKVVLTILNS